MSTQAGNHSLTGSYRNGGEQFVVEYTRSSLLMFERVRSHTTSPTRAWETLTVWFVLTKAGLRWNTNTVVVDEQQVADVCGFKTSQTVTTALANLVSIDAVRMLPRKPHHRKPTVMLNPNLVWRGVPADRDVAVRAWG